MPTYLAFLVGFVRGFLMALLLFSVYVFVMLNGIPRRGSIMARGRRRHVKATLRQNRRKTARQTHAGREAVNSSLHLVASPEVGQIPRESGDEKHIGRLDAFLDDDLLEALHMSLADEEADLVGPLALLSDPSLLCP